ncbi:hypothetical protein A33M_4012 [Rhodovulum sp. PH10]|uniref:ThiF family adenylyltransferase n=1 Tax=Rhodovulum sp. PH10 TaxID=1187851 RepID=UPI00027C254D|nr:ThiF family adenylyltransferase [Rhodovulum sp. PH10]EJW10851.1 hypothetical protein A33M_4012 [Rhodovulum sp. PH10]
MSRALISRNADLKWLRDDGFNIEVRATYLLVKDVPYVTARREVKRGILLSPLNLAGDITQRPDNHQAYFIGEYPCHHDGSQMQEIVSGMGGPRIDEQHAAIISFSQKPQCGYYVDYYEKMATYVTILESQAQALDPEAKARVYRVEEPEDEDTPFNYLDTASSRADINMITKKLAIQSVAIVGLGGTGSYVLDQVAKTPTKEIHTFDGDVFSTHNAFRAPGAPSIEELREQPLKVDHFKAIYEKMHRGIVSHGVFIDASNVELLREMRFVFVCIDKPEPKALIIQKLEEWGVPFVDVGMGLYAKDETLHGIVRVTTSTEGHRDLAREKGGIALAGEGGNDEYDKNIQIADLNMLNAAMAVIRWKKLLAFYADYEGEYLSTYTIDCNMLTSEPTK